MKQVFALLSFISLTLVFSSCSSYVLKEAYPTLNDGQYDSEFPYRGCSQQLEEIAQTVKRVTIMVHYKTYSFRREDSVRVQDITGDFLDRQETLAAYQHHSTAGTGTVIYVENGKVALITCSHVVDFSDTVTTRYVGADFKLTPFIRTISVKTNQLIFLNEVGGGIALDILALDRTADLAILGQTVEPHQTANLRVFSYPLGKSKELEWGSFVYVFGYPAGYRMVTKGIVSLSAKPQGSFVVDAVVSPGASGSIALAIRDGVPHFELVGMIKMIPAQTSYILTPSKDGDVEYDPVEPYHGDMFVQRKAEIQQGIAVAIPTEAIVAFVEKNQSRLAQRGYNLISWIRPAKIESKAK
ncbi:MAG: serine protease [Ignavibacteriales bacterium]|nr:serine protease [Ignavibacteriales bacterium]